MKKMKTPVLTFDNTLDECCIDVLVWANLWDVWFYHQLSKTEDLLKIIQVRGSEYSIEHHAKGGSMEKLLTYRVFDPDTVIFGIHRNITSALERQSKTQVPQRCLANE